MKKHGIILYKIVPNGTTKEEGLEILNKDGWREETEKEQIKKEYIKGTPNWFDYKIICSIADTICGEHLIFLRYIVEKNKWTIENDTKKSL